MVLTITYRMLSDGWEAQAQSEALTCRAQGNTREKAKEGVLAYALEILARDANDGQVSLAPLFPLAYRER